MCNFAHYQGEIMDVKKMSIEELTLWNENAFHLLYKNFYKALVNYAFQFINNDAASEDIVQGLFSQIWEKKPYFTSIYALDVFLYTSVRNKCLNYLKHKNIEISYLKKTRLQVPESYSETDDEDLFPERIYRMLFSTIDQLPKRNREIFLMYIDGVSNKEIADALNISVETVKTHKKRSMVFLRKHLQIEALSLLLFIIK